ncbi:MAG: hypothetical protein ACE5K0_03115 [Candidatus Methanofastidiosia archaeon]
MRKEMFVTAVALAILLSFSARQVKAPTITIIQPNGGEYLIAGGTYEIKWTTSGSGGKVDLWIYYNWAGGSDFSSWFACTDNDGSYTWSVPNLNSSTLRIVVD